MKFLFSLDGRGQVIPFIYLHAWRGEGACQQARMKREGGREGGREGEREGGREGINFTKTDPL